MNENSEVITYIYQNVTMGKNSCTNLIRILNGKDNKIKKIIEGELKGYENFIKKSEKLIKKHKVEIKKNSKFSDLMAKMAMNMEMLTDNSDARVADMLTKGFTMGNVDITKIIDRYKDDCDKDILKLAKDLLKFGEENINLLKEYL